MPFGYGTGACTFRTLVHFNSKSMVIEVTRMLYLHCLWVQAAAAVVGAVTHVTGHHHQLTGGDAAAIAVH